jgi:hypothetical protein
MELLEDADGTVRDAAKTTVIELFRYVLYLIALLSPAAVIANYEN